MAAQIISFPVGPPAHRIPQRQRQSSFNTGFERDDRDTALLLAVVQMMQGQQESQSRRALEEKMFNLQKRTTEDALKQGVRTRIGQEKSLELDSAIAKRRAAMEENFREPFRKKMKGGRSVLKDLPTRLVNAANKLQRDPNNRGLQDVYMKEVKEIVRRVRREAERTKDIPRLFGLADKAVEVLEFAGGRIPPNTETRVMDAVSAAGESLYPFFTEYGPGTERRLEFEIEREKRISKAFRDEAMHLRSSVQGKLSQFDTMEDFTPAEVARVSREIDEALRMSSTLPTIEDPPYDTTAVVGPLREAGVVKPWVKTIPTEIGRSLEATTEKAVGTGAKDILLSGLAAGTGALLSPKTMANALLGRGGDDVPDRSMGPPASLAPETKEVTPTPSPPTAEGSLPSPYIQSEEEGKVLEVLGLLQGLRQSGRSSFPLPPALERTPRYGGGEAFWNTPEQEALDQLFQPIGSPRLPLGPPIERPSAVARSVPPVRPDSRYSGGGGATWDAPLSGEALQQQMALDQLYGLLPPASRLPINRNRNLIGAR